MAAPIQDVAVLGAGVMGSAIAAHLANAGLRVLLLDIVPKDAPAGDRRARNRLADTGLDGARRARPAAFFSPRFETLVRTGNLDDDLPAAAACDVVIEAVVERLDVKRALLERLDALGGHAVIASNTSGLRIADMTAGRSDSLRRRFCVTHFFNPPRYLRLVEIVAGPDTAPATLARAEDLCARLLGKGLVSAKDTPNFIANRIGTFAMLRTLALAVERGYTVEEVDAIFGPALGRPKSAVFRTADVVGIDTLVHVAEHCHTALANDDRRDAFAVHPVLRKLCERGWLGAKSKHGFYRKDGDQILQLDLATFEYVPLRKPRYPSLGAARGTDDVDEKVRRVVAGTDRAAELARTVIFETLAYSAARVPEIADDPADVDRAMRWGFGWERGPFEVWDALGARDTAARVKAAGLAVPAWVDQRLTANDGRFHPTGTDVAPWPIKLDVLRRAGREVERNDGASVVDIGDGVLCLEFHSKMNALDADIVAMMERAVDRAEREGAALVVGNDAATAFSAGANLFALVIAIGQGDLGAVERMVVAFQRACQRVRYARVPVVCAPAGLALGGGAEVVLACQTVRAAAELYVGCVEVGVGLVPAGGGCMEMAARASARAADDPAFDLLSLVKAPFQALAMARVSSSAEDARDLGYLRGADSISMARARVIVEAKEIALGLSRAGWRPSPPRRIRVIGEPGAATLRSALRNLAAAHQISEYDRKVSGHLARIISGGALPAGAAVDEQHILDLEREAFLSLCGEEKTRARIQHMLETGKALRN